MLKKFRASKFFAIFIVLFFHCYLFQFNSKISFVIVHVANIVLIRLLIAVGNVGVVAVHIAWIN